MNLEELGRLDELPWGLHDACVERMEIDWLSQRLVFDVRVKMDERQTMERRVRVTVTGLVYCAMEAPEIDPKRGYDATPEGGLWIDGAYVIADEPNGPRTPDGAFLHRMFVHSWNRSILICGRDATFAWLEAAPVPVRQSTGFRLPGDEI